MQSLNYQGFTITELYSVKSTNKVTEVTKWFSYLHDENENIGGRANSVEECKKYINEYLNERL